MTLSHVRSFAVLVAFCLFAGGAFAVSDDTWGEAWNSASVIGLSNMTLDSNQKAWGSHATEGTDCSASMLFDDNTSKKLFHDVNAESELLVKMTVNGSGFAGKDIVLKKYRIESDTIARSPKEWLIYGTDKSDAEWGDDSLVLIDHVRNAEGATSAEYDCAYNPRSFRTYFFRFVSNHGNQYLFIKEFYLFGEIKDHTEQIVYSLAKPYSGLYDGYAHGLEVTPSYPTTGVTVEYSADGAFWQAESLSYSDVGVYTIYYRLSASGFPTVTDSKTITILEPPQEKVDITAIVREAENSSGSSYHSTTAVNAFSGSSEFTDGINSQRIGWANAKPDGSNTLTYEIYETYRPGDQVTVTGLTFLTGSGVDHSATDSMRAWKFEAWDAANGEWKELVSRTAEEWPAWSSDDLDSSLGAYVRSCFFENSFVSRKYRLTTYSRTFLSDLRILGNVLMVDTSKIQYLSANYKGTYDGEAHGIAVTVQNPEKGSTVSYRALPSGEWTTTNPTFVGPILASEAQQVEFKIEAEGFETVFGTNSVILGYQDLTAMIREAGSDQYGITGEGEFTGNHALFFDGIETQTLGWKPDLGGGWVTLAVSNSFAAGKALVAKRIEFAVTYDGASSSYDNMPRWFVFEGWNEEAQAWCKLLDTTDDPLPEWTEDDKDGNVYRREIDFDNDYAFRIYRFTCPKAHRLQTGEIKIHGAIFDSALKEIFCEGTDYVSVYDGAKHGIFVTVSTPAAGAKIEYSLTGTDDWSTEPFLTKGLVSTATPIYWRVSATGYKTKTGVNTIQITDLPHTDLDLTATIRAAGKTEYAAWTENGEFSGNAYGFINGVLTDRQGWVNPKTGTGYFGVAISNSFRTGESIVVKAVAFAGPTNGQQVIDNGKIVLPKEWSIMGSNDGESWQTIASFNADNYAAWGADDIVDGNYYRRTEIDNTVAYRYYRLGFTGNRTHISEIYLYGDIGKEQRERPPSHTQGLSLIVR